MTNTDTEQDVPAGVPENPWPIRSSGKGTCRIARYAGCRCPALTQNRLAAYVLAAPLKPRPPSWVYLQTWVYCSPTCHIGQAWLLFKTLLRKSPCACPSPRETPGSFYRSVSVSHADLRPGHTWHVDPPPPPRLSTSIDFSPLTGEFRQPQFTVYQQGAISRPSDAGLAHR